MVISKMTYAKEVAAALLSGEQVGFHTSFPVKRFFLLLCRSHKFKRTHIMQSVCQFNNNNPDVLSIYERLPRTLSFF